MDDYFGGHEALKMAVRQPVRVTRPSKFDGGLTGGGVSSQAGRPAGSPALCEFNTELRKNKVGFLSRDARIKERKKYGQRGARRRFQFSKR
jgi:small subunit ribosomal protein S9